MFIIAGIWNILTSVIFGILTLAVGNTFLDFFGLSKPQTYLWLASFLMMVAVVGFKYFLVGLDITKNHLVISSGIISKLLFAALLLTFFILGQIAWPLLVLAGADIIFVALFIEFYVNFKKLDSSHIVEAYAPLKRD